LFSCNAEKKLCHMDRRSFLKASGIAAASIWGLGTFQGHAATMKDRPNILWITCEDISPYLGSYGCAEAYTPNLDKLADEGIRYTQAYANAPVCAVARSALLTGMHSPTLGTHGMRCRTQLPDSIPAYPRIFREAGYYCTNNQKTDYNSSFEGDASLWDESSGQAHWRNRNEGQPFFAVFNIVETHESQLSQNRIDHYVASGAITETPRNDPDDIMLPPYHPDLPEIRQDWVRLHDLITRMDEIVGLRLAELDEAGLDEDTIVFFYADHGGMLARSKRYIYNVGHQVPLIIRFPEKWQHLPGVKPGNVSDRLVDFVDLPKTALSLAGMTVPEKMQGHIFLGPDIEPTPSNVYLYRDRMSERPDFCRSTTDGRWYYIRNFMPHRPNGRDSRYGHSVQANWRAWEAHYEAGKCDPVQSQFFEPKPVVQFFDTQSDPWHVKNLADAPELQERIREMETKLDQWMLANRDVGLIPEPLFYDLVGPDKQYKTLYEYGQSDAYPIERALDAAKSASWGDPDKLDEYLTYMVDASSIVRYWGAYGLFMLRSDTAQVQQALREMATNDSMSGNRIMAAQALGRCGDPDTAFKTIYQEIEKTELGYVFFQAINAFQYSHTDDQLTQEDWQHFKDRASNKGGREDSFGYEYALRIIDDALALWPERRTVD